MLILLVEYGVYINPKHIVEIVKTPSGHKDILILSNDTKYKIKSSSTTKILAIFSE